MFETRDYPVTVRWTGEKIGLAESEEDGLAPLEVATPPEFGGHPHIWSPEHLFVGAVASCFMTTFLTVATLSRLELTALSVPASGTLARGEDRRYRFTRIVLRPRIVLADERDRDRAYRLAEKAEAACLVSRSINTEVVLEPEIEIAGETVADRVEVSG